MHRRWLICLALVAACARDLAVPSVQTLAITPAFSTPAPREAVALSASGGAAAYRWRFAQGSPLSGSDATLDPATGAYRAGARGSAEDVVEVVDQAGVVARARLAVGARLAVTPALTATAPGGTVAFTASGGKPPYRFAVASDGGSQVDADGHYRAGSAGDAEEQVVASDATQDPAASATALVQVGKALSIYRGSTAPVAPRESLPFLAFGGQPPYRWSLTANGSGASLDPATGAYQAGPAGSAADVVTVRDAFAQEASTTVAVGQALALGLADLVVRPGVPTQLVASGGKAPYAFGFAPRGNRSRGTVDRLSGLYTPGANVGADDLVQVSDATGAVASLAQAPVVGPYRFRVTGAVGDLQTTDLNGDGRMDLVLVSPQYSGAGRLTTIALPRCPASAPRRRPRAASAATARSPTWRGSTAPGPARCGCCAPRRAATSRPRWRCPPAPA